MPEPTPDSNISLAQLAYETYARSLGHQIFPPWASLDPYTQSAWHDVVHRILHPP